MAEAVESRQRAEAALARVAARARERGVALALRAWAAEAAAARGRAAEADARAAARSMRTAAAALAWWAALAAERKRLRSAKARVEAKNHLVRKRHRTTSRGTHGGAVSCIHSRCKKTAGLGGDASSYGWRSWGRVVGAADPARRGFSSVALQLRLRAAWDAWAAATACRRFERQAVLVAVQRRAERALGGAFGAWAEQAAAKSALRQRLTEIGDCLARGRLRDAFGAWRAAHQSGAMQKVVAAALVVQTPVGAAPSTLLCAGCPGGRATAEALWIMQLMGVPP
jgi:hypothetical protein